MASNKRKRQCPESELGGETSPKSRPKKRDPDNAHISRDKHTMPAPLPPLSSCLPIAIGGSRWHARRSFQNIVVFGDSYSKSSEGKTWVDHLRRRIRSDRLNIYNFAFPGATAEDDLSDQLSRFFETFSSKEDNNKPPALDPDGTIYFVFLGINDCGTTERDELDSIVENIFDTLSKLEPETLSYLTFPPLIARHKVPTPPPIRSPTTYTSNAPSLAIESESAQVIEDRVKTWNEVLQAQTTEFGLSNKAATVLLFSLHQVLTDVLEDPLEYDFSEDDPSNEGGCIWMDDLHLTSEVHDIFGERLLTAVLG